MYRSTQLIRSVTNSNDKSIAVAFVTKTDVWERKQSSPERQDAFVSAAERYKNTLKPETVKVAIKEGEHSSAADDRPHYSVFEIDENENVVASKHYTK